MRALRLALSFVLIPRLFATLFLLPLLLSIGIVYGQLILTGTVVKVADRDSKDIERRFKKLKERSFPRKILYGDAGLRPPIKVCRWSFRDLEDGNGLLEYPPNVECNADRLDVALRSLNPAEFNADKYVEVFQGNVDRLHICETCKPDVVIFAEETPRHAEVFSIQGSVVLGLADFNEYFQTERLEAAVSFDQTMALIGKRSLHAHGFTEPIRFSGISTRFAFICSIAFLVIITLWLALKAHRKVLDYFARNSALLPMVAATGKRDFYAAIWLLTLFRVGAFLVAAVPLTVLAFIDLDKKGRLGTLFGGEEFSFALWILALVASMSLATMIASIADLKQRHQLLSFLYKYLPLLICVGGAFVWSVTFLFDGSAAALIRSITSALPIIGVAPILIAPVFKPQMFVLIMHTLLTIVLFIALIRHNTRWFAAHLEDL